MKKEVFTTYEIGKYLHVHQTTVINWIKEGRLKAYVTPGGHRRVKHDDLILFMEEKCLPIPEALATSTQKRVLVVDDNLEALIELRDALSGNGFDVELAESGFELGRKLCRIHPDLIVLDFKMPGMDGFEICEIIHKDPETKHIPIIAHTVLSSPADVARIKKHGVVEYLQKPVDPEKLLECISQYLRPGFTLKTPLLN